MKVRIVGAKAIKGTKGKRLKELSGRRVANRQDGIDGQDFNQGPNRGVEAFFDK